MIPVNDALDNLSNLLLQLDVQKEDYYNSSASQIKSILNNWDSSYQKFDQSCQDLKPVPRNESLTFIITIQNLTQTDKFKEYMQQNVTESSIQQVNQPNQDNQNIHQKDQQKNNENSHNNEQVSQHQQSQKDDKINSLDHPQIDHDKMHEAIISTKDPNESQNTKTLLSNQLNFILISPLFKIHLLIGESSKQFTIDFSNLKNQQSINLQIKQENNILGQYELIFKVLIEALQESLSTVITLQDQSNLKLVEAITLKIDTFDCQKTENNQVGNPNSLSQCIKRCLLFLNDQTIKAHEEPKLEKDTIEKAKREQAESESEQTHLKVSHSERQEPQLEQTKPKLGESSLQERNGLVEPKSDLQNPIQSIPDQKLEQSKQHQPKQHETKLELTKI